MIVIKDRYVIHGYKRLQSWRKYGTLEKLKTRLKKVLKVDHRPEYTERKLQAAVLHGPRNLKIQTVPENVVQPEQVRVDVRYCGLTGSDALLWSGDHRRTAEPPMVLGFEVTGTILEMGRLAYEKTGYQRDEEVVVHGYPDTGGLAETFLAHHRDVFRLGRRASLVEAAAVTEDYFSSFLALGRRARLRRGEYFLVNAKVSRSALAVIDLATRVFRAKPIVVCDSAVRAELCRDLGAVDVIEGSGECFRERCMEITGGKGVRLIVDCDGTCFEHLSECLQIEGTIVLLDYACNRPNSSVYLACNRRILVASAEHYKKADTLVYRETMEHLLDYQADCKICPRISAIFGLNRIREAFDYYVNVPSAKVLIDLKNHDCFPENWEERKRQ